MEEADREACEPVGVKVAVALMLEDTLNESVAELETLVLLDALGVWVWVGVAEEEKLLCASTAQSPARNTMRRIGPRKNRGGRPATAPYAREAAQQLKRYCLQGKKKEKEGGARRPARESWKVLRPRPPPTPQQRSQKKTKRLLP